MATKRSKNRLPRAAVAAVLAVTALAGVARASEPDPAIGLTARVFEAQRLLEQSIRSTPGDTREALHLALTAEAAMPPKYSRELEIRNRIIELEEELSGIQDLPWLDEKGRENFRADVLKRRQAAVADDRSLSREKMWNLAALAGWEVHLGLLDDADRHYRKALQMGWQQPYFRSYHLCSPVDSIISALVKVGRDKQAESLLLFIEEQYKAHASNANQSGEANSRIAEQVAKRFAFLIQQSRFDDASALLNEIFAQKFAYAENELSRYYLFNQLNKTFDYLANSQAAETRQKALDWAQQVLAWQLSHYDADDYRVCNTKLELALLNEQNADFPDAVSNYSAALSTAIKYGAAGKEYARAIAGLERIAATLICQPGANDSLLSTIKRALSETKEDSDKIAALNEKPVDIASEPDLITRYTTMEKLAPY